MKNKILSVLYITAAAFLLQILISCSGIVSPSVPEAPSASGPQRFSLSGTFSMPSVSAAPSQLTTSQEGADARNAVPDTSSLIYSVIATSGGTQVSATISEDNKSYVFNDSLTAGRWTVTAYAKTGGGITVLQSQPQTVTLSTANPGASTSLMLSPAPGGSGSIELGLGWDATIGVDYCSWSITGLSETGAIPDESQGFPIYNISVSNVPSGVYELTLSFYKNATSYANGSVPLYECTEYIAVYPGLATNQWTPGSAPHIDSDGRFHVSAECVKTFVYRKVYVSQYGSANGNGTSERPFDTVAKAMNHINQASGNLATTLGISASTPWELHVKGSPAAPTNTIFSNALINVIPGINYLKIIGEGSGATISANSKGRVLYVGENTSVTVENVTLTGGSTSQYGGGVHVAQNGSLTLKSGTIITANTTSTNGGGIYCDGTLTMEGGTISANNISGRGKGVYIDEHGSFTMEDGSISSNITFNASGGGVYTCGTFTMNGGTISANQAYGGNGVYVAGGTFTMTDGSISANTGGSGSGAVWVDAGATFTMDGGSISGNLLTGGVYVSATMDGAGTFMMNGGTISGNTTSSTGGGGVYIGNGATFNMTDGTIKGNSAKKGGGVYSAGNFTMSGGTIGGTNAEDANKAQGDYKQGGGVYVDMNTFEMTGGRIIGNTVDSGGQGSGVYVSNYGTFKMGSTAKVHSSNDVYLNGTSKITVTSFLGSGTNPNNLPTEATITPSFYPTSNTPRQVLDGDADLISGNCTRFAVTPQGKGWHVKENGYLEEGYFATYATIANLINGLTADSKIVITGQLDRNKLNTISQAIASSSYNIDLDLTQATISSPFYFADYFTNCTKLTSVSFDGSKIYPRADAFKNCTNLTTVKITGSLDMTNSGASWSYSTFQGCSNIQTIDLTECTRVIFSCGYVSSDIYTRLQHIKLGSGLRVLTLQNLSLVANATTIFGDLFNYESSMSDFFNNVTATQTGLNVIGSPYTLIACTDGRIAYSAGEGGWLGMPYAGP
ncbi:MAG TPA: hypothetical protein DCP61_08145 [Treponema sp.]|nr:hypothetical protein [Treponema sp.]